MVDQAAGELWARLALEGKFGLIKTLQRAERHESGYTTLVVKDEGFSEDDETHNKVLSFLQGIGVEVFNPNLEAARLTLALRNNLL